ncbi:DNA break repair nuclease [Mortierella claussenii]|nr:DNA break repair nuclease [Mortierella claussenii]
MIDNHIHRKHDLGDEYHTDTAASEYQPLPPPIHISKKKRTVSLSRPRTHSPFTSPSLDTAVSTVLDSSTPICGSVIVAAAVETSEPESTLTDTRNDGTPDTCSAGFFKGSEATFTSSKNPILQHKLPISDCEDKEKRGLQVEHTSATKSDDTFYKEEEETASRSYRNSRRSASTEDPVYGTESRHQAAEANKIIGGSHAGPPALAACDDRERDHDTNKCDEEAFKGPDNLSVSIFTSGTTFESQPDPAYDPDCNEDLDNVKEGEEKKDNESGDFPDIDEIQDWDVDDFQDDCQPCLVVDSVPEKACPVCGIDLPSLDTMTPDAHVNRCLDGLADDSVTAGPDAGSTTKLTTVVAAAIQAAPENPLKSIIGTIRSAITGFPSRSAPSNDAHSPAHTQSNKGNWKQQKKTTRPCPFYKKMPDTSFTVDAFCYGAIQGCDAYFLSHFHSDHYGGLTSTWSHGPIYCSSITANLVISRLRVDPQYVKRLPMYEPTVVNGVTVRLMDANHCPGSVLFVFDLYNPRRRYLHTGDFRACPEMSIDPILCQPQNVPIDILYLDTTYSNPRYTFPPQNLVIREVANLVCKELGIHVEQTAVTAPAVEVIKRKVNIMESWLKKESGNSEKLLSMSIKTSEINKLKQRWQVPVEKDRIVICVGTYLIGKERVFKAIAKAIKSKVFVQNSKFQILGHLEDKELMDMLTSNRFEAQVHLLHMGSDMSPQSLQDYLDSLAPTFTRLIAIRPTGWTFTGGSKKYTAADDGSTAPQRTPTPTTLELKPSFTSSTVKIYPVPYSEHSSFNELAGFVRSLNIHKIIPTVGVGSETGRHAMSEWFQRWEEERRQGIGWE